MSIECIVLFNLAIVEALKLALGTRLNHNYIPLIAVILGTVMAYYFGFRTTHDLEVLLAGLGTVGLFELVRPVGDYTISKVGKIVRG